MRPFPSWSPRIQKNTSVYPVDNTPLHTHKNARMKYFAVMSDDCTGSCGNKHLHYFVLEFLLIGLQWNIFLHDLDVGLELELPKKPVLSLARPNFLTGAIIETRSQASLPAPPVQN